MAPQPLQNEMDEFWDEMAQDIARDQERMRERQQAMNGQQTEARTCQIRGASKT